MGAPDYDYMDRVKPAFSLGGGIFFQNLHFSSLLKAERSHTVMIF
jgi:hypothetical protein